MVLVKAGLLTQERAFNMPFKEFLTVERFNFLMNDLSETPNNQPQQNSRKSLLNIKSDGTYTKGE